MNSTDSATHFFVAVADDLHHFVKRQIVGQELIGIDVHLVLLHKPANGRHFSHTGNAFQPVAQVPVVERAQLSQVVFARLVN